MKLLILSCNTGQGHNSAGLAVKEALELRGAECEMKDTLSFARRRYTTRIVSAGYTDIVSKVPVVFGGIYSAGSFISSSKRKSPVYFANAHYAGRLGDYINSGGFDGVIMPHLFPAEVMTRLRKRGLTSVKCYAVATDYTCIPFWEETSPDYFFIPHADLTKEFADKGIPEEKLIPTGIPVSLKYNVKTEKEEARKKLGIDARATVFLIMTGSMGFGEVCSMISGILELAPAASKVLVLTGRSEKLRAQIASDFPSDRRVISIPFTTAVPLYMDACDVLLTKPGGLTSTEAAVKNVPLVHTRPIPGCETENARFFKEHGISEFEKRTQDIAAAAVRLALNEGEQKRMTEAQRSVIPSDAAERIADFILSDIKK